MFDIADMHQTSYDVKYTQVEKKVKGVMQFSQYPSKLDTDKATAAADSLAAKEMEAMYKPKMSKSILNKVTQQSIDKNFRFDPFSD